MAEWREVALITAAYVAVPGVLIAAWKTFEEVKKLREEKARERLSRIHAELLESLRKLYEQLDQVQAYSQLLTKSATFEGEKADEYPRLLGSALTAARREFVSARLLLPENLVRLIDSFFGKVMEAQIHLGVADAIVWGGAQRAENWKKAAAISHQNMPALLGSIEDAARAVIHQERGPSRQTSDP